MEEKTQTGLIIAEGTIAALDRAAEKGLIAQSEASQFKKMVMVAEAISELRALLTPKVMQPIMALQNTSLGFRTDKPQGYDIDTVKDALIEATLSGVFPVGNEFNIISGRCYITKEGYGHKLRDVKGLTSHMITNGIPIMKNGGAVVESKIDWTFNGKQKSNVLEIPIRVNAGMGADAILGKATRKARAWLYTACTGIEVGDGEVEDYVDTSAKEVKSPFEQPPAGPVARIADAAQPEPGRGDELPM